MNVKESFLSNLIGIENYNNWKPYAKLVFVVYTVLLLLLLMLTNVCHWKIVSEVFSLFTGTSLFFILYVASAILFLDIRVSPTCGERNWKYKLTIAWGVSLIVLGLSAIIYTNHCRKDYALDCETCFVEEEAKCFHIHKRCNSIKNKEMLEESKVYKAKDLGYLLCVECEEWIEDTEFEYESSRYGRR